MSKKIPDTKTAMRWAFPEDEVRAALECICGHRQRYLHRGEQGKKKTEEASTFRRR
jgi:hypothetical protein